MFTPSLRAYRTGAATAESLGHEQGTRAASPAASSSRSVTTAPVAASCRIVSVVATPDPVSFVFAVALAAAISTGVFVHAERHGSRHATAWGIATFLAAGVMVPVYFIRYWARSGARR